MNGLLDFIRSASGDVPHVLYHYTSAESLRRILDSKCILATHFEFTNDPNELRHGLRLATDTTRQTLQRREGTWAEPILAAVLEKLENGDLHEQTPNFVACFSANGDDLASFRWSRRVRTVMLTGRNYLILNRIARRARLQSVLRYHRGSI